MEKFLKYFLSAAAWVLLSQCKESDHLSEYSLAERKKMSVMHFENAERNYVQGSKECMELLEIAVQLDPLNAAAWRELSVPYLKRGLPHEWKPLFDKAVEVDPVAWQGWRGYLKLFFYRDYESAIKDFDATDTLTPNVTDYPQSMSVDYLRGLAYFQMHDYNKALDYMTRYVDEVTNKHGEGWVDVDAFIHRAIVLLQLGDLSKAKLDLERCLKYSPQYADAHYHLSMIALEQNDYDAARQHIAEARLNFEKGYYLQRPYVETFGQIEIYDINFLEQRINNRK